MEGRRVSWKAEIAPATRALIRNHRLLVVRKVSYPMKNFYGMLMQYFSSGFLNTLIRKAMHAVIRRNLVWLQNEMFLASNILIILI